MKIVPQLINFYTLDYVFILMPLDQKLFNLLEFLYWESPTVVSILNRDDIPRFSNNFIYVPGGQIVYISIEPKIMTTSQGLRSYKPHERGCFFKFERFLRFFKRYSQQNCKLECLTNFTRNSFGCVKFWIKWVVLYPRLYPTVGLL